MDTKCSAEQFKCNNSANCIPDVWICDGEVDCPDGSDELDCVQVCDEFTCNNSVCIPLDFVCDGSDNCG